MKKAGLIIGFLLILIGNLTVYSQTTNISGLDRTQKEEIASTLLAYPLVVKELDLTRELLVTANVRNQELVRVNDNLTKQNHNLELANSIANKKLDIARSLNKAESTTGKDKVLYGAGGFSIGVVAVLLISIF